MDFDTFLAEAIEFEKDHSPHVVTPEQNRFGKTIHKVVNKHDWKNQTISTHNSESEANEHAEALNKKHREKHGIKHT